MDANTAITVFVLLKGAMATNRQTLPIVWGGLETIHHIDHIAFTSVKCVASEIILDYRN